MLKDRNKKGTSTKLEKMHKRLNVANHVWQNNHSIDFDNVLTLIIQQLKKRNLIHSVH